jgi:hypothetical protein
LCFAQKSQPEPTFKGVIVQVPHIGLAPFIVDAI